MVRWPRSASSASSCVSWQGSATTDRRIVVFPNSRRLHGSSSAPGTGLDLALPARLLRPQERNAPRATPPPPRADRSQHRDHSGLQASSEEQSATDLVRYHRWLRTRARLRPHLRSLSSLIDRQGQSPFVWSVLGRSPRRAAPGGRHRGDVPDHAHAPGHRRAGRRDHRRRSCRGRFFLGSDRRESQRARRRPGWPATRSARPASRRPSRSSGCSGRAATRVITDATQGGERAPLFLAGHAAAALRAVGGKRSAELAVASATA